MFSYILSKNSGNPGLMCENDNVIHTFLDKIDFCQTLFDNFLIYCRKEKYNKN